MPEGARGGGGSSLASVVSGIFRPRAAPSAPLPGAEESAPSSTMLFHAPQASQRPDHLACVAPQDWQR